MDLILLGTGAPPPTPLKAGPSNAIVADGKLYLIDAARHAATQIVRAGFSVRDVDYLFFTHFHSDHYTGFAEFFISRWIMGAKTPLRVYGPDPAPEIVKRMLHYYEYDIDLRANEGKPRTGCEIEVNVLSPGDTFEVDGIQIGVERGTRHGNVPDILSFRFEAGGRNIVIASDGSPTKKLVPFAMGADILVMHPCLPEFIVEEYGGVEETAKIVAAHHASVEEIGRTATEAKVGKLVFSHVVPPLAPNDKVAEALARHFDGTIVPGEDLLCL